MALAPDGGTELDLTDPAVQGAGEASAKTRAGYGGHPVPDAEMIKLKILVRL